MTAPRSSSPRAAARPRSSTSRWSAWCSRRGAFGQVERVYGARHGVRGIVNEDFVDLTQETSHNLELVAGHAVVGAGLHARQARPEVLPARSSRCCRRTSIRYFFYIGGNDSSDTVRIVNEEARKAGYALRCIHIPKTIDNDLVGNDHTPGLPVGGALRGAGLHRRQPRQPRAARRLHRRGDGPARRLPDRRLGAGQEVPRRRPAPDLPARARLRRSTASWPT